MAVSFREFFGIGFGIISALAVSQSLFAGAFHRESGKSSTRHAIRVDSTNHIVDMRTKAAVDVEICFFQQRDRSECQTAFPRNEIILA